MPIPSVIIGAIGVSKYYRGKGTDHEIIWGLAPKYFHVYGSGVPGTKDFRAASPTFITADGTEAFATIPEYDNYVRRLTGKGMKDIERGFRKPNETPTGDNSYYIAVVDANKYKGEQVINGTKYDSNYESGASTLPSKILPQPQTTSQGGMMDKLFSYKILGFPAWIIIAVLLVIYFANK